MRGQLASGPGFPESDPLDFRLKQEAEECRERALTYLGRPEATFLLRVAREFDRLATIRSKEDPEDGDSTNGR